MAYTNEAGNNLVVVVVVVGHPKRLQAVVKKTRRGFGRRLRDASELRLQRQLDRALAACMEGLSGKVLATHYEDSEKERVLQVADAVAWALFQKHEKGDETFWRIVQENVVEMKL